MTDLTHKQQIAASAKFLETGTVEIKDRIITVIGKDGGLFYPEVCYMFTLICNALVAHSDKEGSCHLRLIEVENDTHTPFPVIKFKIPERLIKGKLVISCATDNPFGRRHLTSIVVDDKDYTRSFIIGISDFEQK
ncbi:hypothetical protein KKC60_04265 [Patescibacteria group bacterium]|nr:hypothetical protein [Patescibacteria group bacterium]